MLAHMHHGIHRERLTQPEIEGQVRVRRHEIRVVVTCHQIQITSTRGLYAHKHLAQPHARDHEATLAHHGVLLGRPPERVYRSLRFGRERVKSGQVVAHGQALAHRPFGIGIKVVGHAIHQPCHQCAAIRWQVALLARLIAAGIERPQNAHRGGRGVQPHPIGQAGVVIGVIGQHQCQPPVCRGLAAQHTPAARQLGHKPDALRLGLVAHHIDLSALTTPGQPFEADRAGGYAPVHLREHHLHRQVARREAVRVLLPLLTRAPRGDELQHRRIPRQRGQCLTIAINGGHREAGGVEHHVYRAFDRQRLHGRQRGRRLQ